MMLILLNATRKKKEEHEFESCCLQLSVNTRPDTLIAQLLTQAVDRVARTTS